MQGRVCIVTGANSGIGKVTASELAKKGATVVLACRSEARGRAALQEIVSAQPQAQVELMLVDLGSLESIRRFVEAFQARHARLDVLVNNAGLWNRRRQVTTDGFEATFGVNHLGPFLLTQLLLEQLKASAPARIVTVSSVMHQRAKLDLQDLNMERRYRSVLAYANAKLCNLLFTYELHRRLQGTGVAANAVHPGGVATDVWRDLPGFLRPALNLFLLTPEQGADTSIFLASAPEVEGVSGQYFYQRKPRRSSPQSQDEALAKGLWETSAGMVGLN